MQETDIRPIGQIIIDLHAIARELEKKTPLSTKCESFELRKIADRISAIQKAEREL